MQTNQDSKVIPIISSDNESFCILAFINSMCNLEKTLNVSVVTRYKNACRSLPKGERVRERAAFPRPCKRCSDDFYIWIRTVEMITV